MSAPVTGPARKVKRKTTVLFVRRSAVRCKSVTKKIRTPRFETTARALQQEAKTQNPPEQTAMGEGRRKPQSNHTTIIILLLNVPRSSLIVSCS